jgi:hypothetical protein
MKSAWGRLRRPDALSEENYEVVLLAHKKSGPLSTRFEISAQPDDFD